jgi:glucans biosynthesis protein
MSAMRKTLISTIFSISGAMHNQTKTKAKEPSDVAGGCGRKSGPALCRRDLLALPPLVGAFAFAASQSGAAFWSDAFAEGEEDQAFDRTQLIEQARRLAEAPYVEPVIELPGAFADLSYDQYNRINFRAERRIWREEPLNFSLDLLHGGFVYQTPVRIYLVDQGRAAPVRYDPGMFNYGDGLEPPPEDASLPFSGIVARYPLNQAGAADGFFEIQGASYFRAMARNHVYGLSARGLAIKTGDAGGEEFPAFTALWIERPEPNAKILVIHALLDSPSCSGAYRFTIRPGDETVIDVELALFARLNLDGVGFAPLTSMYLFGGANRPGFDDYRESVHDSGGLQILTGGGERIWRPLANPPELQISGFSDRGPLGFGLIQRQRQLKDFEDIDSRYDLRPSVWVEAVGDWGAGRVELVEIPSRRDSNDNIVAYWRPEIAIAQGGPWTLSYRMRWSDRPAFGDGLAETISTRAGAVLDSTRRRFVIDFDSRPLMDMGEPTVEVSANVGKITSSTITRVPDRDLIRVMFDLDPEGNELIELRAQLRIADQAASETWLYRWTPS